MKRAPHREADIRAAARRLFYERGFRAVGVDEIGVAAGMAGPSIYRHFKGKDEILATLFEEALDALMSELGSRLEDPYDELDHLVATHAHFVVAHRELAAVLVRDARCLAHPYRRTHTRRQGRYVARWISGIERRFPALARDEARSATFATLNFLNSVAFWPATESRPETSTQLLRDMVSGLLAPLEEVAWR